MEVVTSKLFAAHVRFSQSLTREETIVVWRRAVQIDREARRGEARRGQTRQTRRAKLLFPPPPFPLSASFYPPHEVRQNRPWQCSPHTTSAVWSFGLQKERGWQMRSILRWMERTTHQHRIQSIPFLALTFPLASTPLRWQESYRLVVAVATCS